MNTGIIKIGDSVEIRILQQVEQGWKTGDRPDSYISKIQNILDNGDIEIDRPTKEGKPVSLPSGIRLEFLFYAEDDIYRCIAHIKDRYRQDNLYLFLIEQKTPLERFQRREHYRFECAIDMLYQPIKDDEVGITPIGELKEHHRLTYPEDLEKEAVAVDLSGGGMRFVGYEQGHQGEYMVISLPLQNESMSYTLEVVACVLTCQRMRKSIGEQDSRKKYEYRVKFLVKNPEDREWIIKYIFDQERMRRQKG